METKRIDFIDLAKGFCIILVVFFHISYYFGDPPYELKYTVLVIRMPLYFFLSGLFFKRYEGFVGFIKRKTNKLLIPFSFFYLTTSVLLPLILLMVGYEVRNKDVVGLRSLWAFFTPEKFSNFPIWFLLCLLLVNIFFYVITIISKGRYEVAKIVIISFLVGAAGYFLGLYKINLPMFIDTAFTAIPFFCMGYVFRKYTHLLYRNKYDTYNWCFVIVLFVLTYLFASEVEYPANNFFNTSIFALYFCGLSGTLMVILLSKIFKNIPLISYWGRYSIMILCTHNIVIQVLVRFAKKLNCNEWLSMMSVLVITMFLYLLLIPLMRKFLPYVTAQKNVIRVDATKN